MEEKDKLALIDAIGWTLNSVNRPFHISEMPDRIYSFTRTEFDFDLTTDLIKTCVLEHENIFDYYHGILSQKGDRYVRYEIILETIVDYYNELSGTKDYEILLALLLLVRYSAIQDELGLKEIDLSKFISLTYDNPNDLSIDIINDLLSKFNSFYSDGSKLLQSEFFKNNAGADTFILNIINIINQFDWRLKKFSVALFDKLILDLQKKLAPINFSDDIISVELALFLRQLIEKFQETIPANILSNLPEVLVIQKQDDGKNLSVVINASNGKKAVLNTLQLAVQGFNTIEISLDLKCFLSKKEFDLQVLAPPHGRITRAMWKSWLPDTDIQINSIQELYLSASISMLTDDGRAYFIVSDRTLSDTSANISNIRSKIIENNWLEAVIHLPQHHISSNNISNWNLLIINKKGVANTYFFDLSEYYRNIKKGEEVGINKLAEIVHKKEIIPRCSRLVQKEEIKKLGNLFTIRSYINPYFFQKDYIRSTDETIVKLSDVVELFKPRRVKVNEAFPFINMADLSGEASNFILDLESAPRKIKYAHSCPLLTKKAILIGTIGTDLKPTLYQNTHIPIYLGNYVAVLKINLDKVIPEYLISELNSQFVKEQLTKLPAGKTIPQLNIQDILGICIRLPVKYKQSELFNRWIGDIANNKMKEIEGLHESIRYIERDMFSSFIHDFGKRLLKVMSNIELLEGYLTGLVDDGIINKDSMHNVGLMPGDVSILDVIKKLKSNHLDSVNFVDEQLKIINKGKIDNQSIGIGSLINKWVEIQNQEGYRIVLAEVVDNSGDESYEYAEEINEVYSFQGVYPIIGNEQGIRSILENLLDNAIKHGFRNNAENVFTIYLGKANTGEIELHIANNGRPFPDDFDCQDFFNRGSKGHGSRGYGFGGYSIKRAVDSMGAKIVCSSDIFSREYFTVSFTIVFKNAYE